MTPRLTLPLLLVVAPLCLLLALAVGSVPVDLGVLLDGSDALGRSLVMELRLPRALSAFAGRRPDAGAAA